jgi:hypothetical protein
MKSGKKTCSFSSFKLAKIIPPNFFDSVIELHFGATIRISGEDEDKLIRGGKLSIQMLKTNRVTEISTRMYSKKVGESIMSPLSYLNRLNHFSNGDIKNSDRNQCIISGDYDFDLGITLQTEDSVSFFPSLESIDISLKHFKFDPPKDFDCIFLSDEYELKGGKGVTNVDSILTKYVDLDNCMIKCSYRGCDSSYGQSLENGLYECTVTYAEKRSGEQYFSTKKKVIIN